MVQEGGGGESHGKTSENGAQGEHHPKFTMKVVKFYKTALARQVAEAVCIRRRGREGAILNSRGEFNRCYIPRLKVEEEEPDNTVETKNREHNMKLLRDVGAGKDQGAGDWSSDGPLIKPS